MCTHRDGASLHKPKQRLVCLALLLQLLKYFSTRP